MSRHVRVTIDGDARQVTTSVWRVYYGANVSTLVDTTLPGVTVEDVAPPRTWTPGDVVAGDATVYHRVDGERWAGSCLGGFPVFATDADMTDAVDAAKHGDDAMTVLRYQAGEQ